MKNLFITISIHVIAWGLLLMVPFLSIHQVIKSFALTDNISFVPIIILSLFLIVIFYFNYFVLIPKFLLSKKYLLYVITLVLSIVSAFVLSGVFFNLFDFKPDNIALILF
jgi:hypothetical protein